MISGIDLKATINYQLEKDKENPTVWKIGIIPRLVYLNLVKETSEDRIKASFEVLQLALKGWDNFDVPYATEKKVLYGREMDIIPVEIIERIPLDDLFELAEKAIVFNNVGTEERKN